ncbi:MAG: hypothetical protein KJ955_07850 [Nanoarchaeota archaeon]|nr:hypothetical protein [Nanoarchaeota archaeon]
MAKKSFFRQQRVSEIIQGRSLLKPNRGDDLVAIINNMTQSFAVHVEFPLLPNRFNDARHFLKYGNEARVGKALQISPREAIARALHEAQTPFGSIVVTSRIDNVTVTRTLLDTCIEGMKIYAYACNNALIDVEWPSRFKSAAPENGSDFVVSVPSEKEKLKRHKVSFSNIPVYDAYSKKRLWTDIGAECDCDFRRWWRTSRYIKEKVCCQHIIAAYYAVAAESLKRGLDTPRWAVPFPMFSEEAVEFWSKMRKQVIKTKNGKRYPSNAAERSLLLGDYIAKQGVAKALYHKGNKKMVDFDW